jgi:hypothetical protein
MKIRPVGTEMYRADKRTDRWADRRKEGHRDITKITNTFRIFSSAPNKLEHGNIGLLYVFNGKFRKRNINIFISYLYHIIQSTFNKKCFNEFVKTTLFTLDTRML